MAFIGLTLLASFLHWRGRLYQTRWLLWVFVFAVLGPLVANELGWVAAEVGRQPWIVHPPVEWTDDGDVVVGPDGCGRVYDEKLGLRTADAVSPTVCGGTGARLARSASAPSTCLLVGVALRPRPEDPPRTGAGGHGARGSDGGLLRGGGGTGGPRCRIRPAHGREPMMDWATLASSGSFSRACC